MKKIITYISILAAVLTAGVSCTREASFNQDGGEFTLCFQMEEMGTRVTVSDPYDVAGVGAENKIEHVDYFFFADTDPNSEAVLSGRLEEADLNKISETEYKYTFSTSDYERLKSQTYLYVLVNYPGEVSAKTMSTLLDLPISTDFTEEQTSFVMDSYKNGTDAGLLRLSPTTTEENRTVEVKLARVAAKLILNVNVKNSYEDASGNVWTPVTDQMWVNFVNARNQATVAAEPVEFDDKAFYYTTDRAKPASVTASDANHTSFVADAVYTYPQAFETSDVTAPYFKIFCPWVCDKKGMNNFYYKILIPKIGSFQRNKIYNLTVDLSVIGSTEDDWAYTCQYICVVDWWNPEDIEASYEGAMYLDVPVRYYEIYGIDDVYIPVLSSNEIQVTGITGTKTNLYNGQPVSVSATATDISKDGFKLVHALNTDMTSPDYDCTPITFTMTVNHTEGGLNKPITVTVVQYPSIYAVADESNGYAFVNDYSRKNNESTAYNNRPRNDGGRQSLGSLNQLGQSSSLNNNGNQYVVTVSVLPDGYKVQGMSEDVVIGDPRGGTLTYNYLGFNRNENVDLSVQEHYNAVSKTTQNVIAPAIRIASSWGAQGTMQSYDRAEERCAAYQENGYPAGRWRVPTVAEIDFLIQLSTYEHIPELFTCRDRGSYYEGYWTNGPGAYAGKPYTDDGHAAPYEIGTIQNVGGNSNNVRINGSQFDLVVRCVYDEWYWSSTKYNNQGQPIEGTGTAATQWLGYIY